MVWLALGFIVLCIISPKLGWYTLGLGLALFLFCMAAIMMPSTPVPVSSLHPNGLDNSDAVAWGFFIFIGVVVAFYFLAQWDKKRQDEEKKKRAEAEAARLQMGLPPRRRTISDW